MAHTAQDILEVESLTISTTPQHRNRIEPSYIGVMLPPEIRLQVWEYLCLDWNGKIPNVIKALRPDETLYKEALALFYRKNIYTFHSKNNWSFGDMTPGAVKTITKAVIHIQREIMTTGLFALDHAIPPPNPSSPYVCPPAILSDATSIQSLILHFYPDCASDEYPPFMRIGNISYSPNYFVVPFLKSSLARLGLDYIAYQLHDDDLLRRLQQKRHEIGIKMLDSRLGVSAKLMIDPVICEDVDKDVEDEGSEGQESALGMLWTTDRWLWEAKDGEVLGGSRR
ncbi:hypothetical protein EG329_009598 [Mollisiaceae sp. DMI_Dod_QoI]|nr:hypothetical protein EG329_009598 [Helotiales sp. DMI_Dod_QoI]